MGIDATAELYAPAALIDAHVPHWHCHHQGPETIKEGLHEGYGMPLWVASSRVIAWASGRSRSGKSISRHTGRNAPSARREDDGMAESLVEQSACPPGRWRPLTVHHRSRTQRQRGRGTLHSARAEHWWSPLARARVARGTADTNEPLSGIVDAFRRPKDAAKAGATWDRVLFLWQQIQPGDSEDFDKRYLPRDEIKAEVQRGIEVTAVLQGTPQWAALNRPD